MKKSLVIIAAGGTAGHIMPGLVIADVLKKRNWDVLWLGNRHKMESDLVRSNGVDFRSINFDGLPNRKITTLLSFPFKLLISMMNVWKIFYLKKPDLVIGMGGYITIPVCLVASLKRIPIVLHEQNAVMGRANSILYKFASQVLSGYPIDHYKNIKFVGNPVRNEFLNISSSYYRYDLRADKTLKLLVLGGSLGSGDINNCVPEAIHLLPTEERPLVFHQCGNKHVKKINEKYKELGLKADCVGFIDNISQELSNADLVICRSGAMTIAEITAVGVASLLIPFPNAVKNHQWKNAEFLYRVGAAWLIKQDELTPEWLACWLKTINRNDLLKVAVKAHSLYKPDTNNIIAESCERFKKNNTYEKKY
ncbi:undecaprenyldiphospho-muramoylpentapeptide beta-N-acetylglucosaminyltransferase [Candidatus Kinetoplastidibacterium crithidiae]|uniref:UDP-N-acetylglucosamine--N-acetylmuramyl-(pentapeptide) pyrophosphoryl-undecaprenol N-acetylglucosamine transferase n=1 Tax=Candidatus Kinetoplastidibacterium crithidiae TCC036E TaxID=1208918 RepID=M1L5D9_9PROT|nr:undecaprenyldiphospho-muramoylpentapeptide beta-N-acetylglucosaminyltransferase [Candidatus Kinetoplastibacterium crithidii]AFZ82486.1 undecaprenyldiphospho-muramoylpentapeptide beta-N-acetylglucosaminyltransferase [Candidatus Kinetoplastibacterium crithidii (ex Angomonas deanei ATCC 30255)]AGF47853.1 UDP-N-acetylglucosamine--N-acetylmuramyl-(pentapeptide) pyrophosphoryl-undecaprenol N-acetylglucosamine transferase MurG [Candidatus Kinetoplastibacterium crithidii TCC036E]